MATTESAPVAPRLRIDELAQLSGIASGTIRFYQREGLIPAPERDGRVAYYDAEHVRRLERVRALQAQGLPLALVRDLLEREDREEDVAGWLALDSAVFGGRGGEPVPAGELERLGLGDEDRGALLAAGILREGPDGTLEAVPGMLELTEQLVGAGVPPHVIRTGAEQVALRLRAVADAMATLGWELFAPERERIEADQQVADDVLAKLEQMRTVAERIVSTLFPRMLDEVTRARSEPFAADVVARRQGRRPTG
jgi:DNA-binding transcriptional MerR regulator